MPYSSTGSSISLKKWSLLKPDNSCPYDLSKTKIVLRTYKPKVACRTGSSVINPRKMSGCSTAVISFRAALFVFYIHSNTNKMRKCIINNSTSRGAEGHILPSWCIVLHIWTALLVQIPYTMLTLSVSKPLLLFELGVGRSNFWDVCDSTVLGYT